MIFATTSDGSTLLALPTMAGLVASDPFTGDAVFHHSIREKPYQRTHRNRRVIQHNT